VIPFQKPREETASIFHALQMVFLALIAVCVFQVAKNYNGPHLSVRNLGRGFTQVFGTSSTTGEFIDAINNAEKTFKASQGDLESNRINNLGSLKAGLSKSIDQLRKIPSLAARSDELSSALLRVMQDQYELVQDIERAGTMTFAHSNRLKENVRNYDKVMGDFSKWVDEEGRRYQIRNDH